LCECLCGVCQTYYVGISYNPPRRVGSHQSLDLLPHLEDATMSSPRLHTAVGGSGHLGCWVLACSGGRTPGPRTQRSPQRTAHSGPLTRGRSPRDTRRGTLPVGGSAACQTYLQHTHCDLKGPDTAQNLNRPQGTIQLLHCVGCLLNDAP
jgi:hypothetical protein